MAVAVPATLALAALVWLVVPLGIADWQYQSIRNDLRAWAGAGKAPTAKAWEGAREVLESAVDLAPGNPVLREYLGRLHLTEPMLALSPRFAVTHLSHAVGLRPTAPYPWIALMAARYRFGISGGAFEAMLVRVWPLAPSEPGMQLVAADLGLARWGEMGPSGREVVGQAVAAVMRRNPDQMLKIAQNRGRLVVACAHVHGNRYLAQSSWLKACAATARGAGEKSS